MKKLFTILALILVLSTGALWAQDAPKVEVFGGGSVLNLDDNNFKVTPFGWTLSVAGNANKMFGVVGEIGGNYRDGNKFHNFLGGGQFTHRVEKVSAFAQAKVGLLHFSNGFGDNDLQLGFGGGVDWNINNKVSFRIFQFDWLPTRTEVGTGHEWVKNMTRGSIGVVFKSEPR